MVGGGATARGPAAARPPRGEDRAGAARPGPVFLSLPADVLQAEGVVELGAPTRVAPRIRGDRAAVEAAAELLARAERPLILAGDAVAYSDAHAELVAVAEALGAPVYAEGVANTASFPTSHPLFRGRVRSGWRRRCARCCRRPTSCSRSAGTS